MDNWTNIVSKMLVGANNIASDIVVSANIIVAVVGDKQRVQKSMFSTPKLITVIMAPI